jgi:hypothetical protein
MNRLAVGGFLSALVLLLAYEGLSGQQSRSAPDLSSDSSVAAPPVLSECGVASCCQDSAAVALSEEPKSRAVEPLCESERALDFAVAEIDSAPVFPEPIAQASAQAAPPKPRADPDAFAPASPLDHRFPATSDAAAAEEAVPPLDRIWIMIHPEKGLQFLQTPEEVLLKKGEGAGTNEFFLIDCDSFAMKGKLGEGKPEFVLTCEDFSLKGAFRTAKAVEIKGAKLTYDTGRRLLTLTGTEDAPVQAGVRDNDEITLQAQEIILKLNDHSYQMQVSDANMELITVPAKLQPTPAKRSNDPFGSF